MKQTNDLHYDKSIKNNMHLYLKCLISVISKA